MREYAPSRTSACFRGLLVALRCASKEVLRLQAVHGPRRGLNADAVLHLSALERILTEDPDAVAYT